MIEPHELARALIYTATGDAQVAADWCADLADAVATRLIRNEPAPSPRAVVAWLEAAPAAPAASFFADTTRADVGSR